MGWGRGEQYDYGLGGAQRIHSLPDIEMWLMGHHACFLSCDLDAKNAYLLISLCMSRSLFSFGDLLSRLLAVFLTRPLVHSAILRIVYV